MSRSLRLALAAMSVISAAFPITSVQAQTSFEDGQSLARACKAFEAMSSGQQHTMDQVTLAAECLDYIKGVVDELSTLHPKNICIPERISLSQIVAATNQALQQNVDKWQNSAARFVEQGLITVFPCKN